MSVGFSIAAMIRAASRSFSHVLRMLMIGTPEGGNRLLNYIIHWKSPTIYMIGLLINVCSVLYYALQTLQLSQATELCRNSQLYSIPSLPPLFLNMQVVIDSDMSNYITHRLA